MVIGIGINVNTPHFDEDIATVAASLFTETGKTYDRLPIICSLWQAFEKYDALFEEAGSLAPFVEAYNSRLVNTGRTVRIESPEETRTGTALGIDDEGCLGVLFEDGSVRHVRSGEVSVRGVLGYV